MKPTIDKAWHHWTPEAVVELLGVNLSAGLSADEVGKRQKEFGPNRVAARRGTPAWIKVFQQFNQPLVYILLVAVAVSVAKE